MSLKERIDIAYEALLEHAERSRVLLLHPRSKYRTILLAKLINDPEVDSYYYALGPDDVTLKNFIENFTKTMASQHDTFGRHLSMLPHSVYDDLDAQTALNRGLNPSGGGPAIRLHGGFYLGSTRLYKALRDMPDALREAISMTRIGRINQLYGSEALDRAQRKHARFFNTAMMVNGRGAAISDTLHDGRVVSGIGGQYNFVAMAHELDDGRSVILVRATRTAGGKTRSNIVWEGGEVSVPRHLRDLVVTEYGVADLKGATDREVAIRLARICDSRFQDAFLNAAKAAGKLEPDYQLEDRFRRNTPERIAGALRDFRETGWFQDYPLGSDLTEVERDLKDALGFLKNATATRTGRMKTIVKAVLTGEADDDVAEGLKRMGLDTPGSLGERLEARLVAYALRSVREIS